jgi:F-type H+-transporting ATPase subunit delta
MPSRVQVAAHVADQLTTNRAEAVRAAAAWLVDRRRDREARYLARDIAAILAERGHVLAQVTTARKLSAEAQTEIEHFIKKETGARELELVTSVDPKLVGGVVVELPTASLDASVKAKLDRFVEGAKL